MFKLPETLKAFYPDIQDHEFSVHDSEDGTGEHLDLWTYDAPRPTDAAQIVMNITFLSCPGEGYALTGGKWLLDVVLLRDTKTAEIRTEGSRRLAALTTPYLPTERETWTTQQREARAYTADAATPSPMLTAMATSRSISLVELVAKVLENVALFEAASGAILGQQQALLDQLAGVSDTDPDAAAFIAAINWLE